LIHHLRQNAKHGNRLIGGGRGDKKFDAAGEVRRQVGEIVRHAVGGGQHQGRRSEDLRRIALGFETTFALRAIALHQRADIGDGAEQTVRQAEIEMRRLANCRDRAAEEPLIDESTDDRFLSRPVGRDHDVEQKPRRAGLRRQTPTIDDGRQIGAAKHIRLRRRHGELLEGRAVGRKIDCASFADRRPCHAARCRPQRACEQPAGTHDIAVGDKKCRQAADADGRERAERLDGARHPGEGRIDDVGRFGERSDEHHALRPATGLVTLGQVRHRFITVVKGHTPAAGNKRAGDRDRRRDFAFRHAPAGQHDRNVARHQHRRGRHVERTDRPNGNLDCGFGPDRQAVADVAHVDATIERSGARVKKRKLEVAVLGPHPSQGNPDNAVATFAVERDRRHRAIVGLYFEIAFGLMRAEIVHGEHQFARGHFGVLRQRHEQFLMSAQVGKAHAVDEADIGERHLGKKIARPSRRCRFRGSGRGLHPRRCRPGARPAAAGWSWSATALRWETARGRRSTRREHACTQP
jgi:hypothetical protein